MHCKGVVLIKLRLVCNLCNALLTKISSKYVGTDRWGKFSPVFHLPYVLSLKPSHTGMHTYAPPTH